MSDFGIIIQAVLFIGFYFLPSIIAARKKKRNQGSVAVINLFFGWTIIGWVIALAMSASDDRK